MIKLKMLKDFGVRKKGEIFEVEEKEGKVLLKKGYCEKVKKKDIKKEVIKSLTKKIKTTITTNSEITPFFFDSYKIWWLWDEKEFYWKMCDEIDILNMYAEKTGNDIIKPKNRQLIMNFLKQGGRKNKPVESPKHWIQFKDTIVNIKTGKKFQATPKYFNTNPLPYKLGSSEKTPVMDKLLREWIICKGVQDESYVQTLKEIIAYSACKEQFLQTIIALTGSGSNGKGTFQKLIEKFLGEKNVCSSNLKALAIRNFEASALYKKLACFFGEVDSYDLTNTNLIKSLSGEDLIRYEFKGKTPFSEHSSTTPIIATNSLPITPDKSIGFYRRWLIIDFPNQFNLKRDLLAAIPEKEYENLGLQVVRILEELYKKNEFTNAGTIDERIARYENRSNPLIIFINKNCKEGNGMIKLREFGNEFNKYLKENRLRPYTITKIGKLLRDEGFEIGARYFGEAKTDSAKAIINLCFKKEEIKHRIAKNGSSGSPEDKGGLPKLPKLTIGQNIPENISNKKNSFEEALK